MIWIFPSDQPLSLPGNPRGKAQPRNLPPSSDVKNLWILPGEIPVGQSQTCSPGSMTNVTGSWNLHFQIQPLSHVPSLKKKKSWKSWVCYFEIICNGFAALQDLFSFKWNLTFTSYQNLGCTQPEQEKLQPSNHLQNSKLELFMRKNVIFHFHIFN